MSTHPDGISTKSWQNFFFGIIVRAITNLTLETAEGGIKVLFDLITGLDDTDLSANDLRELAERITPVLPLLDQFAPLSRRVSLEISIIKETHEIMLRPPLVKA